MIRTITFTVDNNLHVSPSSPQEAGVQGDDGATQIVFELPPDTDKGSFSTYDYYIEMTDAAGNYDITDKIEASLLRVSYTLPAAWTQCGGPVQLRLVAKDEGMAAYSFVAKIVIAKRAAAKLTLLPKFKEMVLSAIAKCKEAIAASASAVSSAAIAAESAKEAQDFAADASGNRNVAEQSAAAAEQSAAAAEQSATAAETAASNAESAKSAAESAGLTVVGYLESTAGSKEAAAASAAAAKEKAASAAVSATDAAQYAEAAETASAAAANSATAAGQSADAAAASAAGAAQSAAALENVGVLTLIDSVTLTEEVAEYRKDLPAETYRELYVTATEKLGGTISDKLVRFVVQDGNRVCGIDAKSSAGKTMYVAAHLVTLPGKGHAGIIGVGVGSWINATTSMSPGILDSEEQDGYIRRCRIAVNPSYADTGTVTLAAGTKIMIWGR